MGRKKKEENKSTLNDKLTELEKNFGLQRASTKREYETVKTGIFCFDYVLGEGIKLSEGGHKIELFGRESSGKTTFALLTVKKYQELNKTCVWVVSESFSEEWARKLGVDTDKLLLCHPENLEDAGEKLLQLISNVDLIVVDSVASLIPQAEIERSIGEPTRGLQAKTYSLICRKIYEVIPHEKTTMIFINQIREKLGILYGNPETTPCGRALRHMYDTRIEFRSGKPIEQGTKEKKERIGKEINLYAKKNKLGTPERKAVMDFYFNGTIDNKKSLFFAGMKYGLIELKGKTYSYKDTSVVGKNNFIEMLEEKEYKDLEKEIWKILEKK